jgi:hypothetical protein
MIAFNITQDPRSYGTYKPEIIGLHPLSRIVWDSDCSRPKE